MVGGLMPEMVRVVYTHFNPGYIVKVEFRQTPTAEEVAAVSETAQKFQGQIRNNKSVNHSKPVGFMVGAVQQEGRTFSFPVAVIGSYEVRFSGGAYPDFCAKLLARLGNGYKLYHR